MAKEREKRKSVPVRMTTDQYNLARRRLFADGLTWQQLFKALLNAYIMGDVSVSPTGRYGIQPPSTGTPVIQITKEEDTIEIEPEWGVEAERPQVGQGSPLYRDTKRESTWSTRDLVTHVRETTGRRVILKYLRKLLHMLEIPKAGHRWEFTGWNDPNVEKVVAAVKDGTYDKILLEGVRYADAYAKEKRAREKELEESEELTAEQRRIQHLKRLRQIQEPERSEE